MTILSPTSAPPAYRPLISSPRTIPSLITLPDHIHLQILSYVSLPTLTYSYRLVNKRCRIFATHLLRRILLSSWEKRVASHARGRGSTDPLGLLLSLEQGEETRESAILDLYTTSISKQLSLLAESSLHLFPEASESADRDLFDFLQPRARLEDLVIWQGRKAGLVSSSGLLGDGSRRRQVSSDSKPSLFTPSPSASSTIIIAPGEITLSLSLRTVSLLLPFPSSSSREATIQKVVLELQREEGETLEELALEVVRKLKGILVRGELRRAERGFVKS